MRRKILIVAVLALLAAGVFRFREPLTVRLFPKIVLSRAIDDTCRQLEDLYGDSPLVLLFGAVDEQGRQRIHLALEFQSSFLGPAHLDLEMDTQTSPNRIAGAGTISSGSGLVDLNLQLDENSAAMSSESLTDGRRYGIRYDSFSQDVRKFELIELLLGQDTLESWEKSVGNLREIMSRNYEVPKVEPQDARAALLGVLALRPQVTLAEDLESYSIAFTIAGKNLAQKTQDWMDCIPEALYRLIIALKEDPSSELQVIYCLKSGNLTGAEAVLCLSDKVYTLTASREEDLLRLALKRREGEKLCSRELTIRTNPGEESYRETITYLHREDNSQTQYSADYTWNLSSGDMVLNAEKDGRRYPVRLNLKGEGCNVGITCADVSPVLALLTGKEQSCCVICSINLSSGTSVPPMGEYKNLSEWSTEDLYLLLARMGSLVGLKKP